MFFGLDWSHAPRQSLYAREKGKVPANPTVVGMAYTIGKQMLAMRGTYWWVNLDLNFPLLKIKSN